MGGAYLATRQAIMGPDDTSEVLSEIELRQWTQSRSYASLVSQSDGAPEYGLPLTAQGH